MAKWTEQEEEILRVCAGKCLTAREVMKILKSRSSDSIHNKANQMGLHLSGHKPPEIDLEAFRELTGEVFEA